MSDETRNIKVTAEPGLLLGGVWVPSGQTATVDKVRAETLIREKHAVAHTGAKVDFDDLHPGLTDEQRAGQAAREAAARNTEASELIDWPGYQQLNKGALHTVEAVRQFVSDNPNTWTELLVLTDEDAIAIAAKLEETPAAPKKTKPKK